MHERLPLQQPPPELKRAAALSAAARESNRGSEAHEQPEVSPQVSHFRQVPLRTIVHCPQLWQGSPS